MAGSPATIARETHPEALPSQAAGYAKRPYRWQGVRQRLGRQTRPKISYAEFLAWMDEDTLAEWVDGEVVMTSPASQRHQLLIGFLEKVLGVFVEQHHLGLVLSAPFQMKMKQGREPDLLFVAQEHLDRLQETYLDGPADLVVEVVSPESLARDRGAKFVEYEAGGVPEYWLLDPLRRWAEFYCLGEDGRYRAAFAGTKGTYHTKALPGCWLRVEWLWQEPLPDVARVTWEIIGVEKLRQLLAELEGQAADQQPTP